MGATLSRQGDWLSTADWTAVKGFGNMAAIIPVEYTPHDKPGH